MIRSASLQKASSSLSALNEFSAIKWADLHPKFEAHTKLIKELQSDLDHVFRKIRYTPPYSPLLLFVRF